MPHTPMRAIFAAVALAASAGAAAEIILFQDENFSGRSFRSYNSTSNLEYVGFNDRARSVVVRGGSAQLCSDAYFRGNCVTLGPGEYSNLRSMGLYDRVSSVRELGWTPDGQGGWQGGGNAGGGNYGNGNWGSGERVILYSGYNLSGQTFVVPPGGIANLDRTGFNDRARSLRVESGYWIFCSDAGFQGNCQTYGPGDYASLPSGQDHSISSGRRISGHYPYRGDPNWRGY